MAHERIKQYDTKYFNYDKMKQQKETTNSYSWQGSARRGKARRGKARRGKEFGGTINRHQSKNEKPIQRLHEKSK